MICIQLPGNVPRGNGLDTLHREIGSACYEFAVFVMISKVLFEVQVQLVASIFHCHMCELGRLGQTKTIPTTKKVYYI
jgi:hypothetical protein